MLISELIILNYFTLQLNHHMFHRIVSVCMVNVFFIYICSFYPQHFMEYEYFARQNIWQFVLCDYTNKA